MSLVLNSPLSGINTASPASLYLVCPLYPFPISKNLFASFLWITYSWSSAFAWGCVVSRIMAHTDVCTLTPGPVIMSSLLVNGALQCDWLKSMWRGEDPVLPWGAQCPHQEGGRQERQRRRRDAISEARAPWGQESRSRGDLWVPGKVRKQSSPELPRGSSPADTTVLAEWDPRTFCPPELYENQSVLF